MDFIERFTLRGNALKAAYTAEDSKPWHRNDSNALIDVMADVILRCKLAGQDTDAVFAKAGAIAETELYFAEPALREALQPKAQS